jgi:hypothetical protein
MNLRTGKKDIIIDLNSDDDVLRHEHEKHHRKLIQELVGSGLIDAAEVGEVIITRGTEADLAPPKKEGPLTDDGRQQATNRRFRRQLRKRRRW